MTSSSRNQKQQKKKQRPAKTTSPTSPSSRSKSKCTNYRSIEQQHQQHNFQNDTTTLSSTSYRGFSTSISAIFKDHTHERVDCCAITLCGLLQHDRDRYLLTGVTPPGICKRFVVHLLVPVALFLAAGLAALQIQQPHLNQATCVVLVVALIVYGWSQCQKWHTKRVDIRKDLLWYKQQQLSNRVNIIDLLEHDRPEPVNDEVLFGQTACDMACAHSCCCIGWYADDRPDARLCGCCPLVICGGHVQVCGACALAQEARDVETVLLPQAYRRIDYVTMQAVTDYYPAIYRYRWEDQQGICCCKCPPLSRLSVRLLQGLCVVALILLAWSVGGPYFWEYIVKRPHNAKHSFLIYDFLIFVAAWVQAVGLLSLIIWWMHPNKRSELSLDAMIKFFASGFLLSTSLAVFWELLCSLLIKTIVTIVLLIYGIDVAADPSNTFTGLTSLAAESSLGAGWFVSSLADAHEKNDFLEIFGNDHPVLYTIYIFVTAFFLAALVEELCKYFGYRMVEHPDFFTKRDLDEASRIVLGENDSEEVLQDERVRSRRRFYGQDYSNQCQSFQSRGAAITLSMVCVAMGFTCCENLVYLFVYSNSSIQMELSVLISRSFFPVHPIAAALQSIGVCKRDLEGSRETKLVDILWAALLFHGGYDFFILWIDYLLKRNGVYAGSDDDGASNNTSVIALALSLVISIGTMFIALMYLHRESGLQRQRLEDMDRQIAVDRSRLI